MANAKYSAIVALVCLLLGSAACSSAPSTGPTVLTPPLVQREIDYDINIPDLIAVQSLKRTYPNGVRVSPVEAQQRWDYTRAYGGSPNVYYGEVAPGCEYVRAGIVVAPLHVASMEVFTSSDWPGVLEAGITYAWVGRFTYTAIPRPGTFATGTSTCTTPRS